MARSFPSRTIAGPATDLHEPTGIVVADDGTFYVTNGGFLAGDYVSSDGGVAVYSPGSNGNVGPRARIVGREYVRSFPHYWIYRPPGLALDRRGGLYVLNLGNEGVAKFRADSTGRTPPLNRIAGPTTALVGARGIAVDPHGNIFVTDSQADAIMEYAPDAKGDVAPISTISGPSTGLSEPKGIALDSHGNIYVTNRVGFSGASVTEYASGSNGNVTPVATISGPFTELGDASGIAVGILPR